MYYQIFDRFYFLSIKFTANFNTWHELTNFSHLKSFA